ncbi:MAG TPA: 3-dehydroquinate synthase [Pyrinomonadaceae bacterium]|nr:3-dehydroquinate synthase [Pyrinomonadaceae bacterium]
MKSESERVSITLDRPSPQYQIQIGRHTLSEAGREIRRSLGSQARRAVVISNRRVFGLYGPKLVRTLRTNGFRVVPWLMGDGERFKSLATAEKALQFFGTSGLERTDAVIALGGGVIGDLAGFAAAIYLRGIPLIHVPTTVTAQIDSAIGGKTGVNLPHGKNLIGSIHQPKAVIVDVETLATLPQRELVAGWCEAVKNGAIGSRKLFEQTATFLRSQSNRDRATSPLLVDFIKAQCGFKASVVAQDEHEDTTRTDHRSRRILNFGHTIGHALEATTNYKRFRHGEAVGHGMNVAGEMSKRMGLLETSELKLLRDAIRSCGSLPAAADLDPDEILRLVHLDKKRMSGSVQWVLLEKIGRPRITPEQEIPRRVLRDSLRHGLRPTAE